jgi:adenylate kinase
MFKFFHLIWLFAISCCCFAESHIILVGPPGAGKGTLSQELKRSRNYSHICPGNMLRNEIAKQTKIGKEIDSIVRAGDYVDDRITFSVMKNEMLPSIEQGKYLIVDGYPRSEIALDSLNNFLKENNLEKDTVIVSLSVSKEKTLARIENRVVCPKCGEVYSNRSKDKCGKCGHDLEVRMGDVESISNKRYKNYVDNVYPLYLKLAKSYPTLEIQTDDKTPQEVYAIVTEFLDGV